MPAVPIASSDVTGTLTITPTTITVGQSFDVHLTLHNVSGHDVDIPHASNDLVGVYFEYPGRADYEQGYEILDAPTPQYTLTAGGSVTFDVSINTDDGYVKPSPGACTAKAAILAGSGSAGFLEALRGADPMTAIAPVPLTFIALPSATTP